VRLRTAIEGFTGLDRPFQNLSICVLNGAREAKLPSELDALGLIRSAKPATSVLAPPARSKDASCHEASNQGKNAQHDCRERS